jgi:hypothetical protein
MLHNIAQCLPLSPTGPPRHARLAPGPPFSTSELLFKTSYPTMAQRLRYWVWRASYKRLSRPVRERFATKARILESTWPEVPESESKATMRFREMILELAAKHPGQSVSPLLCPRVLPLAGGASPAPADLSRAREFLHVGKALSCYITPVSSLVYTLPCRLPPILSPHDSMGR